MLLAMNTEQQVSISLIFKIITIPIVSHLLDATLPETSGSKEIMYFQPSEYCQSISRN